MAKAFETWTVLPHDPIVKHAANLWSVRGKLPGPGGGVTRVMTLAKMRDGRLLVHNAIALDDASMKEVEAWGTPAVLVVPNGFHRQDAKIYKKRYPDMSVYCPRGSTKRVAQVVCPDGPVEDAPCDDSVKLATLDGCKGIEAVVEVRSGDGVTIVLNDSVSNVPKTGGMLGFVLAPTGRPSVPRATRWMMVRDKRALRAHLERLAETPGLKRIIVSHGAEMTDRPAEILRAVGAEVTG